MDSSTVKCLRLFIRDFPSPHYLGIFIDAAVPRNSVIPPYNYKELKKHEEVNEVKPPVLIFLICGLYWMQTLYKSNSLKDLAIIEVTFLWDHVDINIRDVWPLELTVITFQKIPPKAIANKLTNPTSIFKTRFHGLHPQPQACISYIC